MPRKAVDAMVEQMGCADMPTERTYLRISAFGFRAQAEGMSGFAALKVMREHNPTMVRTLYTYLAVMGVLVALTLGVFLPE
ncbi:MULTISPECIES: hypothetical protein [Streptomyces]|uniref:hypothetical protein n=1 Tax=Streptomyces TaxID=1883 RepID=UPI001E65AC22|nr:MULTISPECIES: hypothetical protein [Streptomyces]UFQ16237.1 hypothetical protein J2N69_15230 [Streptomyces huasconensis]WCL85841.1 hypothetical protein PPN52_15240 [Streptomyces sp. JCM 35825]